MALNLKMELTMPLCTRKMLLFLFSLIWTTGVLANDQHDSDYIQKYVDSKIGFDNDAVIYEIRAQQNALARQLRIGSRVNSDMGDVPQRLSTAGGRKELETYIDGLTEEERNAPQEVQLIVARMKKSMTASFEASSVQLAVMTVVEEGCGRPELAARWQELFFRLISDMQGKFSNSAVARVEKAYMSNLDIAATEYESGAFTPSCSAELENKEFLRKTGTDLFSRPS